jgi:hypothetical protein
LVCGRLAAPTPTHAHRLIKRATVTGRLLYHTSLTILSQTNPLLPVTHPDMAAMQFDNAHKVCGIVTHVKDRGVSSAALRCMVIASEVLVDRREQEEALTVFDRIHRETGWNIAFLSSELRDKWGWNEESGSPSASHPYSAGRPSLPPHMALEQRRLISPAGIPNPVYRSADFSLPNHPYQQFYRPPSGGPGNGVAGHWSSR